MNRAAGAADALVCRLGGVLLDDLDALTEELVARIRDEDQPYSRLDAAAVADVRRSCHDNLERVLQGLSQVGPTGDDRYDAPRLTGQRRLEQGVPLESVLHAYRLGGKVIWGRLVAVARADGAGSVEVLLDAATDVWELVDVFSSHVADAYRRAELDRVRVDDERRQVLLDTVLDGRGDASALRALGLPDAGGWVVVCAPRAAPRAATWSPTARSALAGRSLPSAWRARDGIVGIVGVGGRGPADVVSCLRGAAGLSGTDAGVSWRVGSAAAIGELARLASTSAAALPAGSGIVALEDHLVATLVGADPVVAGLLARTVLGLLLEVAPAERRLLLETVEVWVASGGSAAVAAQSLFCHRNTVLNRLRRVRELTGRSVERPRDLVELALAVTWARSQPAVDGARPER